MKIVLETIAMAGYTIYCNKLKQVVNKLKIQRILHNTDKVLVFV
jgi:hypothetical protein